MRVGGRILLAGILLSMLVAVNGATAAEKREIQLAGFTGKNEEIFRLGVLDDFEKICDCKVVWTAGLSVHHIAKLEAQRDNPTLDLVMLDEIPQSVAIQKGLLAPLDADLVPNLDNLYDFARTKDDLGVGFGLYSFGVVYNEDVFKERGLPIPTSLHDLYRPEHEGKVVVTNPNNTNGLNALLLLAYLNGGSEREIDRGFEMVKKLSPSVVEWVGTQGEQSALFQQGAAWIGFWSDADVGMVTKGTGMPIKFVLPDEGTTGQTVTINLVKGAKNADLAQQLINYLLNEKSQVWMAGEMNFGPVNKEAKLSPEVADRVVYGEEQVSKLIPLDIAYVNEHRPDWIERFNREVANR